MSIFSDITSRDFSIYLKGNITYKYTANVHTLQTRTTLSKGFDVHIYYVEHYYEAR